jgi:predicted RNA polymerase sigma factor
MKSNLISKKRLTGQTEINQLIDHLFRHESGKIVSVLTRIFGSVNLELAEDVVQDSLVEAIKQWTYKGIPDNR